MKVYFPDFDKAKYFAEIKELTKKLRAKGFSWAQTYSEPRAGSAYRTKLYWVGFSTAKKITKYINDKEPNFRAEIYDGNNVVIKPVAWTVDFKLTSKTPKKTTKKAVKTPKITYKVGQKVTILPLPKTCKTDKKYDVVSGMKLMVGKTYAITQVYPDGSLYINGYNFDSSDVTPYVAPTKKTKTPDCSTCPLVKKPATPKFKVGDKVRVLRKFTGGPGWYPKMADTIGAVGVVTFIGAPDGSDSIKVSFNSPINDYWWYKPEVLELVPFLSPKAALIELLNGSQVSITCDIVKHKKDGKTLFALDTRNGELWYNKSMFQELCGDSVSDTDIEYEIRSLLGVRDTKPRVDLY